MKTQYKLTQERCQVGNGRDSLVEKGFYNSERAAKMEQKRLEKVYQESRYTYYIYAITKVQA